MVLECSRSHDAIRRRKNRPFIGNACLKCKRFSSVSPPISREIRRRLRLCRASRSIRLRYRPIARWAIRALFRPIARWAIRALFRPIARWAIRAHFRPGLRYATPRAVFWHPFRARVVGSIGWGGAPRGFRPGLCSGAHSGC